MVTKLTWSEMKKQYPDEWLLIIDFELDESGHLKSGLVERHSKKKSDIYKSPARPVENSIRNRKKLIKAYIFLNLANFRRIYAKLSLFRFENPVQSH